MGAAVERSPKVILQPLGVWKAHRMSWSVNGVILTRGPFTLEAHRWPFCGNGVGHEITPFTPEPPGRQVFGYGWGAVIQSAMIQSAGMRSAMMQSEERQRRASGQGPRHRIRPCPSEMCGRLFFKKIVKRFGCIACDIK